MVLIEVKAIAKENMKTAGKMNPLGFGRYSILTLQ